MQPEESLLAEPGIMVFADPEIDKEINFGCADCCTRTCCANESLVRVHWHNNGERPAVIAFTPKFPAKVLPVNLDEFGGELFVKSGAFMCSMDPDIEFDIEKAGKDGGGTVSKGVFGGQGFFLVKMRGHGWSFLNAAGALLEKRLKTNEELVVDQDSLVAWEPSVQFGIKRAGSVGMMCCGGEGLTNTKLTGPGYVLLQSMSFERFQTSVSVPRS